MIKVLVDLCLETEQLSVLYSASMGITTMTPTAEDRFDAKEEGRVIQIEQVRTFDALNRAKGILYGRSDDAPAWLTEALQGYEIIACKASILERNAKRNLRVVGKDVAVAAAVAVGRGWCETVWKSRRWRGRIASQI